MASVGITPPATVKIDPTTGSWTGTAAELKELAAYAFETAQPKQLCASPLIRGVSIKDLTGDQHAIFKAAGYPLVIVPGEGEFYIPPESKPDATKYLRAGLEPPLPAARLAELTRPRPSTRIAGAVHGLRPEVLLPLARSHWARLPRSQPHPAMPWMARAADIPLGTATLLREAGYRSMTFAEARLLFLPEGVTEGKLLLTQLKPDEVVWIKPRTEPSFAMTHFIEPEDIRLRRLPDGRFVKPEDYDAAASIWKGLPRFQLESTYEGVPDTPHMVRAGAVKSLAVAESLEKGGYRLRLARDILAEFLVEKTGPLIQLESDEMVWVEPYRKPDLEK